MPSALVVAQPDVDAARPGVTAEAPTPAPQRASSYIPTLDGWRALAVSLVIGAHCSPMLVRQGSRPARLLATFFGHTGYGVDIFFALSGYLICTLLLNEKARTGTISLRRFYVRREFRILPPMLLYLLAVAVLAQLSILPDLHNYRFVSVLLFFRNYGLGSWYTGHFWSLSVEEQFYVVIPVFLLLVRRRWVGIALFVLVCSTVATRWYEFSHWSAGNGVLQFRTENRSDGLLWGGLLALVLSRPEPREWLRRRLTGGVFVGLVLAAAVLLNVFSAMAARRTIVAAMLPLLIAHTVLRPAGWVGRLLELGWLRWLGRLSYSLYLWQMMFLPEGERPLGRLQAFPWALLLPVGLACLSFYVLERPMIRMGHRLARAPGAVPDGRLG